MTNSTATPRVTFFGSAEFAIPSLRAVLRECNLVSVYSQPPRPAGRKRRLQATPLASEAAQHGQLVHTPMNLRDVTPELEQHDLDVGVVVAYGGLLPTELLEVPRHGFLNVHPSLLPRWRGAAPVQRAILAGDSRTGISILRVTEALDAGPIAQAREVPLAPGDTTGTLEPALAELGAELLIDTIQALMIGQQDFQEQDSDQATYAHKLQREEERIDWTRPALDVARQVWAFSPRPGAWCDVNGERLRLLDVSVEAAMGSPGTVLDDQLLIACGSDAVRVQRVQRAGKTAMAAAEFLRGRPIAAGSTFAEQPDPRP